MSITDHKWILQCFTYYKPTTIHASYPKAAVLLPLLPKHEEIHIVFTQRAVHLSIHGGEVAFPGGKYDVTDTRLEHTVLRESYEEIGLKPECVTLFGRCSDAVSSSNIKVTPFLGLLEENVSLVPNYGELECLFTAPLNYFLETPYRMEHYQKRGINIWTPSFYFKNYKIWGLTALILIEFLSVISKRSLNTHTQNIYS